MILPMIVRPCLFGAVPERPFAPDRRDRGERGTCPEPWRGMSVKGEADRLRGLPRQRLRGREVAVATTLRARLLGLAGLAREDGGAGLLIPRCASVHTFGMRFQLDLVFLDRDGRELAIHRRVPPRRLRWHRGAAAVLEIPSP